MGTPLRSLALTAGLLQVACPSPPAAPEPTPTPAPEPVYEILSYDLGEPAGTSVAGDDETVFEVQRFRTATPLRIVAVEARFRVEQADSPAHLALYADHGHNFFDFLRDEPLAEWTATLGPDDDGRWRRFDLEEPLELGWPQLLYVGSRHDGAPGQALLASDDRLSVDPFLEAQAPEDQRYPPHIAVFPDRGRDSGGFEAVVFAGSGELAGQGDLMVRLHVERFGVVEPGETWFSDDTGTLDEGGSGLPGTGSVAFADCNDDGWLDVFDGRLRVNNRDGTFSDITDGAAITHGGAPAWGDFDNDGHVDLFLAGTADALYRNLGECTFEDVTAVSGIDDTQPFDTGVGPVDQPVPTPSASWLDIDNDGWLDLYQANFGDFGTADWAADRLWRNLGDGRFEDVSTSWGVSAEEGGGLASRGTAPADWDNDGDQDLFVSVYRLQRNLAFRNDGDGFVNVGRDSILQGQGTQADLWTVYYGHTIGSAWGDIDNDGDLDLFTGNLAHPRFLRFSNQSQLLVNQLSETGEATFEDRRDGSGLLYQETDSSPLFGDFDNDGWLDLFYTTVYAARPSYLYRNQGDGTFVMSSYQAGSWMYDGWGVAAADLDNDGDLDLYGRNHFVNERGARGGSVEVRAVGRGAGGTNASGIGVRMTLTAGEQVLTREVASGVGVGSSLPLRQHFGLGEAPGGRLACSFPGTGEVVEVDVVAGDSVVVYEDGTVLDAE